MACVTQTQQELGRSTLQARRFIARMTVCYKAVHGLMHLFFPEYITPKSRTLKIEHSPVHCCTDKDWCVQNSFFPMIIRCWNILPVMLIKNPSVNSFKTWLYRVLQGGKKAMAPRAPLKILYSPSTRRIHLPAAAKRSVWLAMPWQQHTAAWSCVLGEESRETLLNPVYKHELVKLHCVETTLLHRNARCLPIWAFISI